MANETVSTLTALQMSAYRAWRDRKIANIPAPEVWLARKKAKLADPEYIRRRTERFQAAQARAAADFKRRLEMASAIL